MKVKMPDTLAKINANLRMRYAAGLSVDIVNMNAKPYLDDDVGIFMRYTFTMADGGEFEVDSREVHPDLLRRLQGGTMN